MRGICPLDLAPELRKLQQSCVEELFKHACSGESPDVHRGIVSHHGSTSKPHSTRLQVEPGEQRSVCGPRQQRRKMTSVCIFNGTTSGQHEEFQYAFSPETFPVRWVL